jgi:putative glutamine transport system substrate-binding protein
MPLQAALPAQSTSAEPAASLTQSTVDQIRNRKNVLIAGVAYDYKPFSYVDTRGQIVGFDVDLVRALAALWGVQVQFVPVTPADRVQKLAAGAVDLVTALPHRWEDEASLDFSQTYLVDSPRLLLPVDAGITTLDQLDGTTIAVIRGAAASEQITDFLAQNGATVTLLPFQEYPAALAALVNGKVAAFHTGSGYARQVIAENPTLTALAVDLPPTAYAFGLRSNDSHFRSLIDYSLQQLQSAGALRNIYAKWLTDTPPFTLATQPGTWPYLWSTIPTDTAAGPSQVEAIRQRGKLVVGVLYDLPPFGFIDATGQVTGFEVDLARAIAARWLGDADAVDLVPVTAATRIPLLVGGAIDLVIATLPAYQGSDAQIDFSQHYLNDSQSLLVAADSVITDLTDLTERRVGAVNGSSALTALQAQVATGALDLTLIPFQEYGAARQAIKAGQVDALAASTIALTQIVNEEPTLALRGRPFVSEAYAIGLRQFDSALRDQVNATLQALARDGTLTALKERWLGATTAAPLEIWTGDPRAANITLFETRGVIAAPPATTSAQTPLAVTVAATATPRTTRPAPSPTRTVRLILVPTATPGNGEISAPPTATLTPSTTATPNATATPRRYIVRVGDTLSTIAIAVYGSGSGDRWREIYAANQTLIGADPNLLVVGVELIIP